MGSNVGAVTPDNELPDGLWMENDRLVFECRNCGKTTLWDAEPSEFDQGNCGNVCGRSERCIP